MKKSIKSIGLAAFFITAVFLTGCASGTKVTVTQEKYSPSFRAGDFSRYKGKKLVLSSFYNQAQNTKTYNYFSPDNKLNYQSNVSLDNFYLNGFTKAFKQIGVKLVDYTYDNDPRYHHRYGWWGPGPGGYKAPKGVPEFQFIILSMTDQEFKFKVLVFKNGETKLDKEYTVTMAAATTENAAELETRGYKLMDLAFTTIMKDREFQKVF
ncbi:MAG: hypothetical protein ABFD62_08175 [Syntrophaceae bacterium]